ncbi:MAG TPA: hypothetical protein VH275_04695 [Solirubrobacterales bacterium]|nr:hypothetical protein [Solirubrobacterales bacterium]
MLTGKRETLIGGGIVNGSPVPGGMPPGFSRHALNQPARRIAQIDGQVAIRYSSKSPDGGRTLVLYVIPTDRGDLGLLCISARWGSRHDPCALGALTLTVHGRRVISPGADPRLARALTHALEPVERATAEPDLVALHSAVSIAEAMESVAEADESAASRIAMLSPEPRDRRAVFSGVRDPLRSQAQALASAAGYARAGEPARYEEAGGAIEEASQQLLAAVANLRAMGYRPLPSLSTFVLPQLETQQSGAGVEQAGQIEGSNVGGGGLPGQSGQNESGSSGSRRTEPASPLESNPTEPAKPLGDSKR